MDIVKKAYSWCNVPQFLVPADRENKKNKLKTSVGRVNECVGGWGVKRDLHNSKWLEINTCGIARVFIRVQECRMYLKI